jgi:predicted permease
MVNRKMTILDQEKSRSKDAQQQRNRYSEMPFWRFGIITFLVTAFFPWYLILNTIQRGIEDTKQLLIAMVKDWIQTVIIIFITIIIVIGICIYFISKYFS